MLNLNEVAKNDCKMLIREINYYTTSSKNGKVSKKMQNNAFFVK